MQALTSVHHVANYQVEVFPSINAKLPRPVPLHNSHTYMLLYPWISPILYMVYEHYYMNIGIFISTSYHAVYAIAGIYGSPFSYSIVL